MLLSPRKLCFLCDSLFLSYIFYIVTSSWLQAFYTVHMCHICQSSVSCSCHRLQFWQASLLCRDHVVCSFDRPVFCVVIMSSSAVLTGQSSVSCSCRCLQFWQACLLVVLMSLAVVLTCQSSVSPSCRLQFWQASLLCPAHVVVCSFDRPVLSELWQF